MGYLKQRLKTTLIIEIRIFPLSAQEEPVIDTLGTLKAQSGKSGVIL